MSNERGTVWTVFNGEIYNHRDIQRRLEQRGHVFRGRSDTEVIPHMYEEDRSPAFASDLRGMFAIAVYDADGRRLLLCRDRFGIKPLFYALTGERLAFASELGALLEVPGIDRSANRQAVIDFASLCFIPAPQTFYSGIRALEPGCWLEARLDSNGSISTTTGRFHSWHLAVNAEPPISIENDVEARLHQAVARQLESDVPLGSLLSGGIDSSLVSRAAQAGRSSPLSTFNVRFGDAEYDETWAATRVARHIGSTHHTLDIDQKPGTWDDVTALLLHAGQPFADTSLFAVSAVCRAMRQFVVVALSGDGGDEAFGGYDTFWQIERILRFQRLSRAGLGPGLLAPLASLGLVSSRTTRRMAALRDADDTAVAESLFSWMDQEEHDRLCRPGRDILPLRRWFEQEWEYRFDRESRLERLSARITEIFTRLNMANDFLFKVDIASMRESLEVRVPLLDEDLFELGLTLPHHLKVSNRVCKKVLRSIARRWLPAEVAAKAKRGFAIPVDTWVTARFKQEYYDALTDPACQVSDYFDPRAYRPIVEAFCDRRPAPEFSRAGLYQRAIMLLALHLNLERNRRPVMADPVPAVGSPMS